MIKLRLVPVALLIILAGISGHTKNALAATNVFYSVGQATSSLMTGSPTVTITSGTSIFSIAQTGNIGVGDKVIYGSGQIAYITGKTSSDDMHWTLITATGGTPSNATNAAVTSITRTFTSLAAAIASSTDANHLNTTDLVAGNYILNIPCYYDSGPDTTPVVLTNALNTGPNNYLTIYTPTSTATEANQDQRSDGVWSNGKYRMEISNGAYAIQDQGVAYLRVDGLQFKIVAMNQSDFLFWVGNGGGTIMNDVRVSNSIFWGLAGNTYQQAGMVIYNNIAPGTMLSAWNNILYNFKAGGGDNSSGAFIIAADVAEWHAYNNTVYNSDRGYWNIPNGDIEASSLLFNNIAQGSTYYGFESIPNTSGYNISDLNDAPGIDSKSLTTVAFVSTSTPDLHLAPSDVAAVNAGINVDFSAGSHEDDSFDRANGPLGSNWTNPIGSEANLIISSDTVMEDAENNHAYAYWSANSFNSDQYSQDVIGTLGQWVGVTARTQSGSTDQFYLAFAFGTNDARIDVRSNGSYITLLDATTTLWNSGDTIRLEATGSNPVRLSLYKNNTLVGVYDDNTYLIEGGSPGIGLYSPSGQGLSLEDWEGGDVGTSTTSDDIDHQARPCGSGVDIGADEYCPPSVTAFSIPSISASTTIGINTFTGDDDGGDILGYLITETTSTPSLGAVGWTSTPPAAYTFASQGTKTLYAWVKDDENISLNANSSIVVDTSAPSITAFTIPASGSSLTFPITTFTATDNVGITGYLINQSAEEPGLNDPGWSVSAPSSYTASSYGATTLYAWARDATGNISASANQSTTLSAPQPSSNPPPTTASVGVAGSAPPPSVPLNVSYTIISPTQIHLSWNPPATYYLNLIYSIYRKGILIATSSAASYIDSNISLSSSSSYTYTITAEDESGFMSGYSSPITITASPSPTVSTPAPTPTPTIATTPSANLQQLISLLKSLLVERVGLITKMLEFGSQGSDVTALQQFLIISNDGPAAQALANHGTTGTFATLTKNALIEFQKDSGITPASGIFEPTTKHAISSLQ
jgi:hypothetical protein